MKKISLGIQLIIGTKSGIGWYGYNLTKELCKNNRNIYTGNLFKSRTKNLNDIKFPNLLIKEKKFFSHRRYNKLNKYISYNFLMNDYSDIYHFFDCNIPLKIRGKIIITIHDLIPFLFPELCPGSHIEKIKNDFFNNVKSGIRRSDIIITISEYSKQEILKYFKVDSNKIKIVSPGIELDNYNRKYSEEQTYKVKERYKLPEKFILYLGMLEPKKNIVNIILAFNNYKITSNDKTLKLIIAGKKGWKYENIFEAYENSKYKKDIKFIDYVDEEDKILLYKLAKLFIFPSLYEGFGMPVLEAMAAGTPVITSNISSLPEVAGGELY